MASHHPFHYMPVKGRRGLKSIQILEPLVQVPWPVLLLPYDLELAESGRAGAIHLRVVIIRSPAIQLDRCIGCSIG
jgi:hypothetical protein